MRKAVKHIQETNDKLKYGPYPPRKDGGFGWFIVQETADERESPDPAASGLNVLSDSRRPERGCFHYFWFGSHFSNDLYRQGMQWMFEKDLMLKAEGGRIPEGLLDDDDLARLIRLNLVEKIDPRYQLTIPVFTRQQLDRLEALFSLLVKNLQNELGELIVQIWREFHRIVPGHLHDQINQYLAGYVHRLIGLTVFDMMRSDQLAAPPKEGPLHYGVFFVERA